MFGSVAKLSFGGYLPKNDLLFDHLPSFDCQNRDNFHSINFECMK